MSELQTPKKRKPLSEPFKVKVQRFHSEPLYFKKNVYLLASRGLCSSFKDTVNRGFLRNKEFEVSYFLCRNECSEATHKGISISTAAGKGALKKGEPL